ncbi:hypothetical protein [Clostridium sp. CCUG 7971]|uniref:hypothetical protein n=1 Tax=Clostridium sp. CCUG 7971 TaxID=2811414 RepID=UPI001ABBBCB9|nr:hypothetical protein [Clostridium sp. CCUG 7971]MBO3445502.1 hypothetical protein [Clostridium sp. CCUG 7971]
MKRFIKISISILIVFTVFFIGNKLIFKDMIHVNDYEETNIKEIRVDLYDKKEVKEGTIFKFKIKNESKYTYRLNSAKLIFQRKIEEENEEVTHFGSNIELTSYERNMGDNENHVSESDKMFLYGIKPYKEGYVEFLFPKGLTLDKNYFDLYSVNIDFDGRYTVDLPFLETGCINVQQDNRSHSFNFEAHNKN